jgi:hypothetical protein
MRRKPDHPEGGLALTSAASKPLFGARASDSTYIGVGAVLGLVAVTATVLPVPGAGMLRPIRILKA